MAKCLLKASLHFFCLFVFYHAHAQDSTSRHKDSLFVNGNEGLDKKTMDSIDKELNALLARHKSHIHAGLDYLTNNVFYGRKDTVVTPYVTADLGYYHKSGLFVNASASYLAAGQGRVDLVTLEAGYGFISGKFQGQVDVSKYFYNSQSNVVDADLKAGAAFFAGYDLGFMKATVAPMLMWSARMDFATTFGIEHTFYAAKRAFDITPTINASGSTQHYYNSYYKDRKFRVKIKRLNTNTLYSISGEVVDAAAFKILDYQFSLPVNYTIGKFMFTLNPAYIIPVHPAVVALTTQFLSQPPKTRTGTEKINHSFYLQAGVMFKF